MPNRIIKESICTSEDIDILTPEEEIFFYRLLVNCDDFGLMDARPQILRSKCFPLRVDRISIEDVEAWLARLALQGLVVLYSADNKPYLKLASWESHQQVRAKRSKYPQPQSGDINCNQLISDDIKKLEPNALPGDINCNQLISNVPENPIQSESLSESNPISDGLTDYQKIARWFEKNLGHTSLYPPASAEASREHVYFLIDKLGAGTLIPRAQEVLSDVLASSETPDVPRYLNYFFREWDKLASSIPETSKGGPDGKLKSKYENVLARSKPGAQEF